MTARALRIAAPQEASSEIPTQPEGRSAMKTRRTLGLSIVMVVGIGLLWTGTAQAECPRDLKKRPPEQVLGDHRAALAAQDWDAARCNFHPDATMISDNGVSEGVDAIIAEFQALAAFFGGNFDQVYQEIVVSILDSDRHMARVLYTVDTACSDVPDGIDTFVIRKGQILALTTHGFIVFTC
jgi:hypothetical protein